MATTNDLMSQFKGLTLDNVGSWPLLPRLPLWVFVIVLCAVIGWFMVWSAKVDDLDRLRQEEIALKDEYKNTLQQPVNLGELRKPTEQASQYVLMPAIQLPTKS